MTTTLIAAIIFMVSALTCYTIGVWSEKLAGTLKSWHLAFFWLGFIFDTVGTALMGRIAGSFSINIHSVLGALAILLMLVHALWATIILIRKDEEAAEGFHKFSIIVWVIWLIPFFVGLFIAMRPA
ncbi:MAG: membrane protein [Ardenticatenaceae bacterium]|nr:MAG: membrane protein [Ardenticatenaceae bacterium]